MRRGSLEIRCLDPDVLSWFENLSSEQLGIISGLVDAWYAYGGATAYPILCDAVEKFGGDRFWASSYLFRIPSWPVSESVK